MLESTLNTFFNDRRLRPDAKHFCPQTGANLIESRRTDSYVLLIPLRNTEILRQWKRSEGPYEQILVRAQEALHTTTIPLAASPLHNEQPLGSTRKINKAICRGESVYWMDETNVFHKLLCARQRKHRFQVKLVLDQHWHDANSHRVFCSKQPGEQNPLASNSEPPAATPTSST
ncbi:hypothetical protein [Reticulibacter mediterranei]|uniref:hypothetical protein n=1 Tax=Reticulibacter mediterranei TaxID=2778369 RepID=UPI001C689690|nr:hypothetical protein [Reticulibacter mediterranei]